MWVTGQASGIYGLCWQNPPAYVASAVRGTLHPTAVWGGTSSAQITYSNTPGIADPAPTHTLRESRQEAEDVNDIL